MSPGLVISTPNMLGRKFTSVCLIVLALYLICPIVPAFAQSVDKERTEKDTTSFQLSPEKYQKAIQYRRARYVIYFVSIAYTFLLLGFIIRWKLVPRFRQWAENISSKRIAQVAIITPLLVVTISLLTLPIDVYGHSLSLKYEQSIQMWGSWFWDWVKSLLIGVFMATLIVWVLYGVIRKSPMAWWFFFWLASLPIILFVIFITPVVIDPLFFKFEPMVQKAPELVEEIGKVVERGGLSIPGDRMFLMNASEKLKSVNAYVTGFGASKRVVVWDTTIAQMTNHQTLYVFGHEMGHYVLNHVIKTVAFIAILLLLFLYIGFRYMRSLVEKYGIGWDIREVSDYASLPVFIFLFTLFSFLATPIISGYSRVQEHNSDIYGLEVIHGIVPEPQKVAAQSFQILGEINLSDPEPPPFIKFWMYSHPPLNERLTFARSYDPWKEGKPRKYVQ